MTYMFQAMLQYRIVQIVQGCCHVTSRSILHIFSYRHDNTISEKTNVICTFLIVKISLSDIHLRKYAATKRRCSHIKAKNFYENPATALKHTYAVVRADARAAVRAGVCRRTSKTRLFLAGFVRLKYLRQWPTSEGLSPLDLAL